MVEKPNEGAEQEDTAEQKWRHKEPLPVVDAAKLPPEYFDILVIDERHRWICSLWRKVIEHFAAYLIGPTATPANRTCGFLPKKTSSATTPT